MVPVIRTSRVVVKLLIFELHGYAVVVKALASSQVVRTPFIRVRYLVLPLRLVLVRKSAYRVMLVFAKLETTGRVLHFDSELFVGVQIIVSIRRVYVNCFPCSPNWLVSGIWI